MKTKEESQRDLDAFRNKALKAIAVRHVMVDLKKSKAEVDRVKDLLDIVDAQPEYLERAHQTLEVMYPDDLNWYLAAGEWVARNGWQEGIFIVEAAEDGNGYTLTTNRIKSGSPLLNSVHECIEGAKIEAQLIRERSYYNSSRLWRILILLR